MRNVTENAGNQVNAQVKGSFQVSLLEKFLFLGYSGKYHFKSAFTKEAETSLK